MHGRSGQNHPARATYDEKTRLTQLRFLERYQALGNISEACAFTNVHQTTVDKWRRLDVQGFYQRFINAREIYADYLESIARKRIENPSFNGRIGSDVLLIAQLNAKRPSEYRQHATVTHDLGARVIATLRDLQARDRPEALTPLPESVIEGEIMASEVSPGSSEETPHI